MRLIESTRLEKRKSPAKHMSFTFPFPDVAEFWASLSLPGKVVTAISAYLITAYAAALVMFKICTIRCRRELKQNGHDGNLEFTRIDEQFLAMCAFPFGLIASVILLILYAPWKLFDVVVIGNKPSIDDTFGEIALFPFRTILTTKNPSYSTYFCVSCSDVGFAMGLISCTIGAVTMVILCTAGSHCIFF